VWRRGLAGCWATCTGLPAHSKRGARQQQQQQPALKLQKLRRHCWVSEQLLEHRCSTSQQEAWRGGTFHAPCMCQGW
jgi:hypothetical protein